MRRDAAVNILAVDPGTTQSAFVVYNGVRVIDHGFVANEYLLARIVAREFGDCPLTVIEKIEAMGMAVGKETFETVFWAGRFAQASEHFTGVTRRQVKLHLCGTMRAKDPNIRQVLLDRFGSTKKGGALHGITAHKFAALAVAVTWWDAQGEKA